MVTIPINPKFEAKTLQAAKLSKRKRVNNEKELREQLEKLQVELGSNRTSRISLEELITEKKLGKFVEQQIMKKD